MDATEAAVHFASALGRAGIPHAIGGAIAYGFFGAARGTHDVDIDLFFNSIPVHERAATRTRQVTLHGVPLRVLSPEDTAVFKMLFFRGKDLVDVERLLGIMQGSLDRAYVRAALVEVVGEDDYRTKKWDELIAQLVMA